MTNSGLTAQLPPDFVRTIEEEETSLFPDLLQLPPAHLEQLAVEVRQRQQELMDIEVEE
jgi:hypothetical protein